MYAVRDERRGTGRFLVMQCARLSRANMRGHPLHSALSVPRVGRKGPVISSGIETRGSDGTHRRLMHVDTSTASLLCECAKPSLAPYQRIALGMLQMLGQARHNHMITRR